MCSGANVGVHSTVSFSSLPTMCATCPLSCLHTQQLGSRPRAAPPAAARMAPPIEMAACACELAGV